MAKINADEITELLRQQIENYQQRIQVDEVGTVISLSLNQAAFTTQTLTGAVIYALTAGAVYAIAASGLVVTYATSGIFNFAQGAIGMVMAFLYWELRVDQHWPAWLAIVAVVLVIAPVLFWKKSTGTCSVVILPALMAALKLSLGLIGDVAM